MVNFLIVTHGEFGAYLVEAAEEIVGPQREGVRTVPISSRLSMDQVKIKLEEAVKQLSGKDGLIVATDIPGGTPSNAVLPLVKDAPGVAVVSGLNLYMLISGFGRRKELPVDLLAARMIEDGRKTIQDMKALLASRPARTR
ncbi:MAG: PTS sugar transporter subunit IIA [Elusimicrobia bacterium]|nr:PTS sugar transporter subunit IIA [Elusimicrobiota bacterium]